MPKVYDDWERLVEAVLDREKLREIAMESSFNSVLSSEFSSRFSFDSSLEDVHGFGFPSNSAALSSLNHPSYNEKSSVEDRPGVERISFEEIKLATDSFRVLLGEGRFGPAFRGRIKRKTYTGMSSGFGMEVAVKKWNPPFRSEWARQLHFLRALDHPNVLKLIAYCFVEKEELLLIYEFMPNGSLANHLFQGGISLSLSWASRIKVAVDVARALAFLHSREMPIGHQNVEVWNILLDSRFNSKLSGFSSAGYLEPAVDMRYISTRFGTYNFSAPGYLPTGDVFDFGIVLLELLSGKYCAADKTKGLVENLSSFSGKKLFQIMDKRLENKYPQKLAQKVAALALRCVSHSPHERPLMAEVLSALEKFKAEQLGFSYLT